MLTHYLVLAWRGLRRAPVAAAVNVVTLALGLVALVTAYAFVAFWGRADTQFEDVDRIYLLRSKMTARDTTFPFKPAFGTSVAEQAASYVKADFPALEKVARVLIIDRKTMVASGGEAVRLIGAAADPEFLELFALPFVAGDAQNALREPRSVVLTQEYAAKLFAGRDPIGQPVLLANSVDATVTGVLGTIPEPSHLGRTPGSTLTFDLLASVDVLEAVRDKTMDPRQRQLMTANNWFGSGAFTYLLLPREGLSPATLNEQLGAFAARHMPAESLRGADYEFDVTPLRTLLSNRTYLDTGLQFGTVLLLLGGLVLGVACVNYANLATARASLRAREIGVRKTLGAPPRQIMLQTLIEASLLTAAALVTAVIVFLLSGPVTRALLQVDLAPTLFADWRVWPFLALLLAGVTLAAGFYPAFVLSRVRPASAIASADVRLGSKFFSLLLVGTQFAIASFLVLVVMIISLQNAELERTGLGTTEDPLVLLENPANITKVDAATLRGELSRLPQVQAVTEIGYVPWEMVMMGPLSSSPDPGSATRNVFMRPVGFDFFDVFGMPLLAGRLLDREHAEDLPPAPTGAPAAPPSPDFKPRDTNVVIDRAFAAEFGLGSPEEAVGKTVYRLPSSFGGPTQAAAMNVVGVVEDRVFSFFAPMATKGAMYQLVQPSSTAGPSNTQYTVARVSKTDVSGALAAIDAMWKSLAPTVPIGRRFVDDVFNTSYEYYLRINRLFGLLALLAFVISIAGLFGMATLVAARRRQEVGVRKAHGASTLQIVRLLLTSFSKPVVVANLVAWPLAIVAGRMYLKQFMDPIQLTPLLFVGSLVLMLAIAWLAVGTQTIRAARLTPAQVLRHE